MRITFLSLIAAGIMTTLTYAGGEIEPVQEPAVTLPETAMEADGSGFYLGAGVSAMKLSDDFTDEEFSATGVMLQAGYRYNRYIALEARYTLSLGDVEYDHGHTNNPDYPDYPTDFTNFALYLKPIYPVGDFSLYALLGYGEVALTNIPQEDVDRAESGFQWGVGVGYRFTPNISVFVDYVRMYDDTGFDYRATEADVTADVWTLGVSYTF